MRRISTLFQHTALSRIDPQRHTPRGLDPLLDTTFGPDIGSILDIRHDGRWKLTGYAGCSSGKMARLSLYALAVAAVLGLQGCQAFFAPVFPAAHHAR